MTFGRAALARCATLAASGGMRRRCARRARGARGVGPHAGRRRSRRTPDSLAPAPDVPPLRLESPVQYLKGVGQRRAELLAHLGIRTARDLLFHIPFRYLDATTVTPIARARGAATGEDVTVVGRVISTAVIPTRRGLRVFQCVLKDESGMIECGWPGRPFLERTITKGTLLLATGPIRHFHGKQLQPREWIVLGGEDEEAPARGLVLPVYPVTEGLTVRQMRALLEQHLGALLPLVEEGLPAAWRQAAGLVPLPEALGVVHRPARIEEAEQGRRRLAFEELMLLQLVLARARWLAKRSRAGIRFEVKKDLTTKLREHLPFELTNAQKRCLKEIVGDQTSAVRMHRLLQGDVGSGKTVVALFAMLLAVENGYQAAMMAPTEILAEQHAATLQRLLAPLGMVPELLIGRLSAGEKAAIRDRLASGASLLVVGTHALIQEEVGFRRLGLVVIDEQHRFGVAQRALLAQKNAEEGPDVLLLSATPIPRTLALAVYGDLDVSRLDELPPGRGRIRTAIREERSRPKVYDFIRSEIAAGRQAYVVYPVIDETEKLDLKAATKMAELLAKEVFPEFRVGLVHGRLAADERDRVMRRFRANEMQVLVATTVIEVGIDVPNATVMVIEHPERFGLAQLHQLRGRIGRGVAESQCILMPGAGSRERLDRFADTLDGFKIAELDLAERGHGELVGAKQAGPVELRYADFARDGELLALAHRLARETITADPTLSAKGLRPVVVEIGRRFERGLELFRAIPG
ncbi:MAG: ATP-dependent DNA helicase RecG [Gemmatimonadetes bacterium]|nr:ATP-dependent DNA helicase RecG [Gemmatimonadota bacterium]